MGSGGESVDFMFPIREESEKAKIIIYGAVWTAIQWEEVIDWQIVKSS